MLPTCIPVYRRVRFQERRESCTRLTGKIREMPFIPDQALGNRHDGDCSDGHFGVTDDISQECGFQVKIANREKVPGQSEVRFAQNFSSLAQTD